MFRLADLSGMALVFLLFLLATPSLAQEEWDITDNYAASLLRATNEACASGDLELCSSNTEQLLGRLRQLKNEPEYSGKIALLSRFEAITLIAYSQVKHHLGLAEAAIDLAEEALRLEEEYGEENRVAEALDLLGVYRVYSGQLIGALEDWERAVEIFGNEGDKKRLTITTARMGGTLALLGRYSQGLARLQEATTLAAALGDPWVQALVELNMGEFYSGVGEHDRARRHLQEAADKYLELGDVRQRSVAQLALAGVLTTVGLTDEALAIHAKVDDELKSLGALATLLDRRRNDTSYGELLLELGRIDEAQERMPGFMGLGPGLVYLAQGKHELAVLSFAGAQTECEKADLFTCVFASNVGLGYAFLGWDKLKQSKQAFEEAVETLEVVRNGMPPTARRRFYAERDHSFRRTEPYEGLVQVLAAQKQASEAFLFSEKLKGRVLSEKIAAQHQYTVSVLPEDLRRREVELAESISAITSEVRNLRRQERYKEEREAKDVLQRANNDLRKFVDMLRSKHPRYAAVMYPEAVSPGKIGLRKDEVLVEFEVTRNALFTFVVSHKGKVEVFKRTAPRSELVALVKQFRGYFEGVQSASDLEKFDTKAGLKLFEMLLKKPLAKVRKGTRVIIVPDEILGVLPFDALVTSARGKGFSEGPHGPIPKGAVYLGDKYLVSYAHSATSLALLRALGGRGSSGNQILVVADPVFGADDERRDGKTSGQVAVRDGLIDAAASWKTMGIQGTRARTAAPGAAAAVAAAFPRLELTAALAAGVKERYGPVALSLTGLQAQEQVVRESDLTSYRTLLFATHGILDDALPWIQEPALVLSQFEVAPQFDGFLSMSEVMSLRLAADIVVLTACDTGVGEMLSGEGVMGMGAAFQHAGARNVLMTMWSVAEESTTLLSDGFLRGIDEGKDPSEALRQAREEIRAAGYAHPFYWAGFVLVGGGQIVGKGAPADAGAAGGIAAAEAACQGGGVPDCLRAAVAYRDGQEVVKDLKQALSLFQRACNRKSGEGCYQVGFLLARGQGAPRDLNAAFENYRSGCDLGVVAGCRKVANYYLEGYVGEKNPALAVSMYRKLCDGGDAGSCARLGGCYDAGAGVKEDKRKAVGLFKDACKKGVEWSCNSLGISLEKGAGVKKNMVKALEAYKRSCELGFPIGCRNVGNTYFNGVGGIEKNTDDGLKWLRRSCEGENGLACAELGHASANGNAVAKDQDEAIRFYRLGCDYGNAWACNQLGYLHANGKGVPKDISAAKRYYEKGCDWSSGVACTNLGRLYEEGSGVEQDLEQALNLYKKGCEAGNGWGCRNVAIFIRDGKGTQSDPEVILSYFRRACEGGDARGCRGLARCYHLGRGTDVIFAEAATIYEKACELEDSWSCWVVGDWYQDGEKIAGDLSKAAVLLKKGCDGGEKGACYAMAWAHRKGAGVPFSKTSEVEYFAKACNLGDVDGCNNAMAMYYEGDGVPQDTNAMLRLAQKGCELGDGQACHNAGVVLSGTGAESETIVFYQKGCDLGHLDACNNLGVLYKDGGGGYAMQGQAAALLRKACDGDIGAACLNLAGMIHQFGSMDEYCDLMQKGCDLGMQQGCDYWEEDCD